MEVWHNSELLYEGKIVRLRAGEVTLDNGKRAFREVVEHPGGVCVVPFTGHSVIFVRQFRIALNDYILEAPAGKLEPGDSPEHRGACELEEETGYVAGDLRYVGKIFASVGFCTEAIHICLALNLRKTKARPEEDERIELVELSIEDVRQGLREHRFEDGKTVVGLHALLNHLREQIHD